MNWLVMITAPSRAFRDRIGPCATPAATARVRLPWIH